MPFVPVCQYLFSDSEPFQRPGLLLAEDFPGIPEWGSRQSQPCLFPPPPLSFTSGPDVSSEEVGGGRVFLFPPSLRGGAGSLIPTPHSHSGARDKLLLQNGDLQVTKRSVMASVLIRGGTGSSQRHSPAAALFGYISSSPMKKTCRQLETRMCLGTGPLIT